MKRVALVAERNTPVRLTFAGGEVELRAGAGDEAQASEAVECAVDGDAIEIAFNPQYLLDGLGALDDATTRLSFTTSTRPAVLTGGRPRERPRPTATSSCRCGSRADARPSRIRPCTSPPSRSPTSAATRRPTSSCGPGVTSFLGRNGQGKTNLVEALGYVATLGSHRVATDAPLVRLGASAAVVRAQVVRDDRATLVEIEINPGRANRARINRSPVPRPREVLGILRTVLFAPEDLALVKGDPAERRRFLDDLLVARTPRLAGVRADYDRVLKQRNALLKTASAARRGGAGPR